MDRFGCASDWDGCMDDRRQRQKRRRRAIEALRLGLDLGMNHIDTAEMYGNGRAEEMVGEAVAGRRDRVFLVSKVLPSNASYEQTLKACELSLKRLKTDFIDLYLLHWPSSQYPVSETMRAMEKLVDEGMIKFIGVSNFESGSTKGSPTCTNEAQNCLQPGAVSSWLPWH